MSRALHLSLGLALSALAGPAQARGAPSPEPTQPLSPTLGAFVLVGGGVHDQRDIASNAGYSTTLGVRAGWQASIYDVALEFVWGRLNGEVDGEDWLLGLAAGARVDLGGPWSYHPRMAAGAGSLGRTRFAFRREEDPPIERKGALALRLEPLALSFALGRARFRLALPIGRLSALPAGRQPTFELAVLAGLGVEFGP